MPLFSVNIVANPLKTRIFLFEADDIKSLSTYMQICFPKKVIEYFSSYYEEKSFTDKILRNNFGEDICCIIQSTNPYIYKSSSDVVIIKNATFYNLSDNGYIYAIYQTPSNTYKPYFYKSDDRNKFVNHVIKTHYGCSRNYHVINDVINLNEIIKTNTLISDICTLINNSDKSYKQLKIDGRK